VASVVTIACSAFLQQLQAAPFPAEVEEAVTVTARRDSAPLAGLRIEVRLPDGRELEVGSTDEAGTVTFVPTVVGVYVFATEVDGIRLLAPYPVVEARRRWLLAIGCVPVGLAVLWQLSRSRGRRGS
jgi:hypothetical protein